MVKKYTPNIVLVNLCFDDESDMDAFTWIALTREISPITKILGYTSTPTRYQAAEAFRAGASGYYATQRGPDELLKAIETLMQNVKATYCEKMVSDIITDVLAVKLTVKQREVLKHIGLGKSTKAIAHDLILGETTIKTHLGNIFQMLNLESRTEAALFAVATGMVSPRRVSLALEIS